ncbi:hypothetical protein IAG44_03900 [Streptomyces roseirectus]|uniref:Uncharacterized protein n=1 Tax=Streptomyces roseirectus TaxID=2768066 RepID=A0A7H0I7C5_9ACTN|nr:hypothetical protein [Streptomyces roseirectus]QNP68691.1 hypothetical protein IAG44_03900 [Streptomyces roseirectus]
MEDDATHARRARFGTLPERIRYDDLVEEKPATPLDPSRFAHEQDRTTLACLALDLGL